MVRGFRFHAHLAQALCNFLLKCRFGAGWQKTAFGAIAASVPYSGVGRLLLPVRPSMETAWRQVLIVM